MNTWAIVAGIGAALLAVSGCVVFTPDRPRAALEASYAQPPSRFVEIAGLRLHIREEGPPNAPAVVLLHGFGASLQTWDAWAAGLASDHRVIRYDLPGFGLTGAEPAGDYSDERGIAVLLGLLDQLGLPRASIVGHSMGGRLAWRFAAAHPERVARLVLVAPDGFASPDLPYGQAESVPLTLRALPYVLPTPLLRAGLAPAYADPATLTEPLLARYRDMLLAPGVRQAIVDRTAQHVLVPPEPLLRRIRAPTLLLWGEQDGMIPVANAADYQRELPDSRLVVLPGLGHIPQEEQPARGLTAVRAFLDESR